MTDLEKNLVQIIERGKQALAKSDFDFAFQSFEKAVKIAREVSPSLNSIIGISYAYMALVFGKKSQRQAALEYINTATEFFPVTPVNPLAYASVLLGLGIEFQKIDLFECSIIVLKNALTMARMKTTEANLQAISITARNLAFSYSKIGSNVSSAKLFRIAADLEDEPQIAIDLYRNSAFLYYQEEMKEYALNILQTAFDKAGILGNTDIQMEIARFQGIISYEIVISFLQRGYMENAIAYLDLCNDKFTFTKNSFWVIKTLFEKAMIFNSIGKVWQRNEVLEKVSLYQIDDTNEEYIIKALLLLAIHALEGEHYSKADYYIRQVSDSQLDDLRPPLIQKIRDIKKILKLSRKRGQLYANLHFTRKDLDLPIEELIPEEKTPSQEITIKHEEKKRLEVPKLDISPPKLSLNANLQQPSIEVLQDLFDSPEEVPSLPTDQEPYSTETQAHALDEGIQESVTSITAEITSDHAQDRAMALERLFKGHQLPIEHSVPVSPVESEFSHEQTELESPLPEESIIESVEPQDSSFLPSAVSQDVNIRSVVVGRLQKAGWSVELNFINITRRGSEPDVIATKGLIRKSRKLIFFAENPADAEICSFLLQSNPAKGDKIIFLLNGEPSDANVSVMVKITTQIDQIL